LHLLVPRFVCLLRVRAAVGDVGRVTSAGSPAAVATRGWAMRPAGFDVGMPAQEAGTLLSLVPVVAAALSGGSAVVRASGRG